MSHSRNTAERSNPTDTAGASTFVERAAQAQAGELDALLRGIKVEDGGSGRIVARAFAFSKNWTTREASVEALGEVGCEADFDSLIPRLSDRAWCVRAAAASSLGTIGSKSALPFLHRRWAREKHAVVRRYVAVAIADILGTAAIPFLDSALASESDEAALLGIYYALAQNGVDEHFNSYLECMKSGNYKVAVSAIENVEDLSTPKRIRAILRALDEAATDRRPTVRLNAMRVREAYRASLTSR